MNAERNRRLLVTALIAVTALLILFAVVQGVIVYKNHQEKLHQSQAWAHQMTDRVAADISQQMEDLAKVGDSVASALSSASCSPCDIEATLRLFYLKHSEFTSLGVAFDKLSAGNQLQLYAPFIRHNSANARIERLDSLRLPDTQGTGCQCAYPKPGTLVQHCENPRARMVATIF